MRHTCMLVLVTTAGLVAVWGLPHRPGWGSDRQPLTGGERPGAVHASVVAPRHGGAGGQARGDSDRLPPADKWLAQLIDPFTGKTVPGPTGAIERLPAGAWFTIKEPIGARVQRADVVSSVGKAPRVIAPSPGMSFVILTLDTQNPSQHQQGIPLEFMGRMATRDLARAYPLHPEATEASNTARFGVGPGARIQQGDATIIGPGQLGSGAVTGTTQIRLAPGGTVTVAAVYMVPNDFLASDLYVEASAWESRLMSPQRVLVPIPLSR
jgi:hypothetical protein